MSRAGAGAVLLALLGLLLPLAAAPQDLPEVYDLRQYTHPNFTRIVVDIGRLREYTYQEMHAPDRITVNILQAKLNPILYGEIVTPRCDYLSQIRIAQGELATVRLVADLDFKKIRSYRVWHLPDPFRIILDIYPLSTEEPPPKTVTPGTTPATKTEPKPTPPATAPATKTTDEPLAQPPAPSASGYSLARQLGLGIRTVVLDAGHGGADPGCLSAGGKQKEKDIVLDVALRLRNLLQAAGLEVLMTRETDIFIPLEKRTILANQKKADLFLSIHANASFNKKRTGIETFYLNLSPDPSVNALAAMENATSTKTIGEMKDILQKIIQNSKILESRDLAEKVQKNLVEYLSKSYAEVKDLAAKGGPFWVLIGGDMPSVLAEISHLSNSAEEARLRDEAYRQRIAEGIFRGIEAYRQSLGKGTNSR